MSWFNSPSVSFKSPKFFKKKPSKAVEEFPEEFQQEYMALQRSHTWQHAAERQPPGGRPKRKAAPKPAPAPEPAPAPLPAAELQPDVKMTRAVPEVDEQEEEVQPAVDEPMRPQVIDLQHLRREEDMRRDRLLQLQSLRTDHRGLPLSAQADEIPDQTVPPQSTQFNSMASQQGLLALKAELGSSDGGSMRNLRMLRRQLREGTEADMFSEGSSDMAGSLAQLQLMAQGDGPAPSQQSGDSLERLRLLRQDLGGSSSSDAGPTFNNVRALRALNAQEENEELSMEAIKMKLKGTSQTRAGYVGHVRSLAGDRELPDSICSELTPSLPDVPLPPPPTDEELHELSCEVRHMLLCLTLDEQNPIAAQKAARPKRRRSDDVEGESQEILDCWTMILGLQKEIHANKQEWQKREGYEMEWRPVVWENLKLSPPEEQVKQAAQRDDWQKSVERARTDAQRTQPARAPAGASASSFLSSLLDIAMPSFMSPKAPKKVTIQHPERSEAALTNG